MVARYFWMKVGELPLDTQIALLRVLQEREFERVGGKERIKIDVRIIAAMNRDLNPHGSSHWLAVRRVRSRQSVFYSS